MKIACACPVCGSRNEAEWSQIGQTIACLGCRKSLVVPAPMEAAGPAVSVVKFRCPACNRKFATKTHLAGKKIRCNGCGAGVRVPEVAGDSLAEPKRVPTPHVDPSGSRNADALADPPPLFDELASVEEVKKTRPAGSILPSRTEAMEQLRQQATDEAAVAREKTEKARKKKKKRKKSSGDLELMETLKLVAGVGAVVGVLTLVAWGYPDLRFPLGGLFCVVGFVVYLLGITSLRQLVAEEGVLPALLFRFCPPYQWWYIATRWGETRDFVAFFGAGMLILSIGGFVIKTSPTGRKAEAADRAYQAARQGVPTGSAPETARPGNPRAGARATAPPIPSSRQDDGND